LDYYLKKSLYKFKSHPKIQIFVTTTVVAYHSNFTYKYNDLAI